MASKHKQVRSSFARKARQRARFQRLQHTTCTTRCGRSHVHIPQGKEGARRVLLPCGERIRAGCRAHGGACVHPYSLPQGLHYHYCSHAPRCISRAGGATQRAQAVLAAICCHSLLSRAGLDGEVDGCPATCGCCCRVMSCGLLHNSRAWSQLPRPAGLPLRSARGHTPAAAAGRKAPAAIRAPGN